MTCFDQLREFRADESRRAGFDHQYGMAACFDLSL